MVVAVDGADFTELHVSPKTICSKTLDAVGVVRFYPQVAWIRSRSNLRVGGDSLSAVFCPPLFG